MGEQVRRLWVALISLSIQWEGPCERVADWLHNSLG